MSSHGKSVIMDFSSESLILYMYFTYRGDDFRTAFAHLGEIRSIIPSSVKVLALTASA